MFLPAPITMWLVISVINIGIAAWEVSVPRPCITLTDMFIAVLIVSSQLINV